MLPSRQEAEAARIRATMARQAVAANIPVYQETLVHIPKPPTDCILVLTIFENRITGWNKPTHYEGIRYREGTSFVFLSQNDIDQYIPDHTFNADEAQERLDQEYQAEQLLPLEN